VLVAEQMNRVSVLIMKDDMETVLQEIARCGVLHLIELEEIDEWAESLKSVGVDTLSNEYTKRRRKINELIEEIAPEAVGRVAAEPDEIAVVDLGKIDSELRKIETDLEPIMTSRRVLAEKIAEHRSLRNQIEALGTEGLPVPGLMRSTLLATAIGTIAEDQLESLRSALKAVPSVILPYRKQGQRLNIVGVVLRRDRPKLEDALKKFGFAKADIPKDMSRVSEDIAAKVAEEMAKLEQQLEDVKADIAKVRQSTLPALKQMLGKVDAAILLLRIKDYCRLTEKTCLFSGWVPREETTALVEAINRKTGGKAIVEITEADKIVEATEGRIEVPVLFKHPPFLKPFEMLVAGYGTPSYRMIDPTLFVGITFLVMFGMMFGDVGHGLVLAAAGVLFMLRSVRWKDIGRLAIYCGAASAVFGVLYGSFFGLEEILPTVWVKPLENITDLFKAAIGFGIVMVSLGIILNIINSLRTHSFVENFFDKSGPLVGVVYWAGVGIVIKFMATSGGMPSSAVFYGLFVAPLAAFAARGPLLRLMGKRRHSFPEGVGTYAMESVVEILEILMGYLANTVSFIRVAAFGLAHAGLFIAVFSLASVVASKPGGLLLSWLVLVLGNVVIILLEGLVVTIQALRLEYYEFFGKFFRGLGSKYEPARPVGRYAKPYGVKGGE
jgi:V/A-type H+-transporting ATPase subunit I